MSEDWMLNGAAQFVGGFSIDESRCANRLLTHIVQDSIVGKGTDSQQRA